MNLYTPFLDSISEEKEQMIAELMRWVNINSGTTHLEGLSSMLHVLKEAFQKLDAEMEEVELKPYRCFNDEGVLIEQPLGKALVMSKRKQAPIQIFLGGHMDTVFPKNSPFQKALRVDEEILKGPGAADMKGGLMILLKSLEMLEKTPFAKNLGWKVVINTDEEIGSPGSAPLITEVAKKCSLGLIFEPCLPNGSLVGARKGSLNFTVVAKGKSAHAGRNFHEGANAISALSHFILKVEKLINLDEGITVNVGKISGGSALNTVPDLALCGVNVRVVHQEDMKKIKTEIKNIIEQLNKEGQFSLQFHINSERGPKPFDEKQEALFELLRDCAQNLGTDLKQEPSGGLADGNTLFAAGVPSIDTLGAFGEGIHTFDEFIQVESLVNKTKLVSLFLMKLANGDIKYGS